MERFTYKEFTIDACPDNTFRVAKISPVDLLAITTQIDFDNIKQTTTLVKFCLENVEVRQGDKWFKVKLPDKEFYTPVGIENNFVALNQLFMYMMNEVVAKVFHHPANK